MVQKDPPPPPDKRRGRPRAYDPEVALRRATDVFWRSGYTGTSLDDLATAMEMNRPSVYGAFGDKRALYLETLRRYHESTRAAVAAHFAGSAPVREQLAAAFGEAIAIYTGGAGGPRGCYTVGTAVTEAAADPEVAALLLVWTREMDAGFARLFARARDRGELAADADPAVLGTMATAALHTLAVRARIGAPRAELATVVQAMVTTLCGPASKRRKGRPATR
jgi:TetR/AcrR family transcriptional regulator, copper-responsive repressor